MGVGLLVGLVIIAVLLMATAGLLIYSIRKKSRTGIIVSSVLTALLCSVFLMNYIDQWTLSKDHVKTDLLYFNVKLDDDFRISRNSVSGMPERYQETELLVSKSDLRKIINDIRRAKNFTELKTDEEISNDTASLSLEFNDEPLNFKYPGFYSRELVAKIDNINTRLFLNVTDGETKVKYQKFEE